MVKHMALLVHDSTFAIKDVERGEHTLQVKLLNNKNQIIAMSQPVYVFYAQKGLNTNPQ